MHCVRCLEALASEDEACERCTGEHGATPDQRLDPAHRRAVEAVAVVMDDLMDRRSIKWALGEVCYDHRDTWAELVATNVANVRAVLDGG